MTKQQAFWASTHDWFEYQLEQLNGVYLVCVKQIADTGEVVYKEFTDYQELRNWAGY